MLVHEWRSMMNRMDGDAQVVHVGLNDAGGEVHILAAARLQIDEAGKERLEIIRGDTCA